jgi:hypothetical protein
MWPMGLLFIIFFRSATVKVELTLPDIFTSFPVTVIHPLGGVMSGGDNSAKIVHESEPQEETQEPGTLVGEPQSIGTIKGNLFAESSRDRECGVENIAIQSENTELSEPATDLNSSISSQGFSVHEPSENDESEDRSGINRPEGGARASSSTDSVGEGALAISRDDSFGECACARARSDSQSSGYAGSDGSERQIHVENRAPHDQVVMRHAMIQRTTSGTSSLSSSLSRDEMRHLYDRGLQISGCKRS